MLPKRISSSFLGLCYKKLDPIAVYKEDMFEIELGESFYNAYLCLLMAFLLVSGYLKEQGGCLSTVADSLLHYEAR